MTGEIGSFGWPPYPHVLLQAPHITVTSRPLRVFEQGANLFTSATHASHARRDSAEHVAQYCYDSNNSSCPPRACVLAFFKTSAVIGKCNRSPANISSTVTIWSLSNVCPFMRGLRYMPAVFAS